MVSQNMKDETPAHLLTEMGMSQAICSLNSLLADPAKHQTLLDTLRGIRNITT